MNPFVSIITVNYNGKKYLEDFLDSVSALDYPQDKYEIIIVDNASTDSSVNFIRKNYPNVEIIKSSKNLGFGGGNNLGIKHSKGDLIVLLNNDTVVNQDFLNNFVTCYKKQEKRGKVGAINAKIVLFDKYIPLTLKGASLMKYEMPKTAQARNTHVFNIIHDKKEYREDIYFPYNWKLNKKLSINIYIQNSGKRDYEVQLNSKTIEKGKFDLKEEPKSIKIKLNKNFLNKYSVDLIQNAGTVLFKEGSGRDRGAVIIEGKQYYEADQGQYDKEEEIEAFCGAGVLLNRRALDKVGFFDEDFFMYYEDCELSLRMKSAGWKVLYCPDALIRHIHSGSSKEWSPFFIYQAEKNRLLLLAKHWPRIIALREWMKYLLRSTFGSLIYYVLGSHSSREYLDRFKLRLRVNLALIIPFTKSLLRNTRLSKKQIEKYI